MYSNDGTFEFYLIIIQNLDFSVRQIVLRQYDNKHDFCIAIFRIPAT